MLIQVEAPSVQPPEESFTSIDIECAEGPQSNEVSIQCNLSRQFDKHSSPIDYNPFQDLLFQLNLKILGCV